MIIIKKYLNNVHSDDRKTGCHYAGDVVMKEQEPYDGIFVTREGIKIKYSNYRSSRREDRNLDQYCIMKTNHIGVI